MSARNQCGGKRLTPHAKNTEEMIVCLVMSLPTHRPLLDEIRDVGACGQACGTVDILVTECGAVEGISSVVMPLCGPGRAVDLGCREGEALWSPTCFDSPFWNSDVSCHDN